MNDAAAQVAEIKANSTKQGAVQIRQVQGGFVVAGSIQYLSKDTKGVVMAENAEGVASTAEQACQMATSYLNTGDFGNGVI